MIDGLEVLRGAALHRLIIVPCQNEIEPRNLLTVSHSWFIVEGRFYFFSSECRFADSVPRSAIPQRSEQVAQ
jgi:hypothetical protein